MTDSKCDVCGSKDVVRIAKYIGNTEGPKPPENDLHPRVFLCKECDADGLPPGWTYEQFS